MRNIKDQVVEAVESVMENVTDTYPTNWADLPAVQITEETNRVHEYTADGETKSYVRYRIDIWHNRSTSEASLVIDGAVGMGGLGLYRTECGDAPDPSQFKHKVMRYEGIIDMENDFVEYLR